MTPDEAVLTYCNRTPMAQGTIRQIVAWDERRTMKENAMAIGVTHSWAIRFARRFGLKYK